MLQKFATFLKVTTFLNKTDLSENFYFYTKNIIQIYENIIQHSLCVFALKKENFAPRL